MMTKIARLFEEEKEQAVKEAVAQKNLEIEREKKKNEESSARLAEKNEELAASNARIAELEALLAANQ